MSTIINVLEEFRKYGEWKAKQDFGSQYKAKNPRWL